MYCFAVKKEKGGNPKNIEGAPKVEELLVKIKGGNNVSKIEHYNVLILQKEEYV